MSIAELTEIPPHTTDLADSPYSVEWDAVPNAQWDRLVDTFSDGTVYQTATYAEVRMRAPSYRRLVLRREGAVVGLCLARIYRIPFVPAGFAIVTFGPLWKKKAESPDAADLRELLRALYVRICKEAGLGLVISPIIYDSDSQSEAIAEVFREEGFSRRRSGSPTPVMSLTSDVETLRKNLEKKWRNRLNAAERQGLRATLSTSVSDFDSFCQVYFEMRRRKQYRSHENVPQFREVFVQTEEALRPRVALCWKEDRPVAGAIISWLGDTALYLYGGTSSEGLELQAANLLHWNIVKCAKASGFTSYDLMTVSAEAPWFKRGLCGKSGTDVRRIGPFAAARHPWNRLLLRFL